MAKSLKVKQIKPYQWYAVAAGLDITKTMATVLKNALAEYSTIKSRITPDPHLDERYLIEVMCHPDDAEIFICFMDGYLMCLRHQMEDKS